MKGQLTVVWQRQLQKMHNGPRGGGREAEGGAGGCGLRRRKTRTKKQENRPHATVWAASGRCLRIFDALYDGNAETYLVWQVLRRRLPRCPADAAAQVSIGRYPDFYEPVFCEFLIDYLF